MEQTLQLGHAAPAGADFRYHGVYIVFAPIQEFVLHQNKTGLTLLNLLALGGLIWLARRAARPEASKTVRITDGYYRFAPTGWSNKALPYTWFGTFE